MERFVSARARLQADGFDSVVTGALSSWEAAGLPSSERIVTLYVSDSLDGDGLLGTSASWAGAARALARKLLGMRMAAERFGMEPSGPSAYWQTETLAWAGDRDAQYEEISRSMRAAQGKGARLQVVARGRGAETILASFRRGRIVVDRMLVLGPRPAAGDEKLAADAAFVYATPNGAEMAYKDAGGALVRVPGGSAAALLTSAKEALSIDAPFVSPLEMVSFVEAGDCKIEMRRRPRPGEKVDPNALDSGGRLSVEPSGGPLRGSPAELIRYRMCTRRDYDKSRESYVANSLMLRGELDAEGKWNVDFMLLSRNYTTPVESTSWLSGYDRSGRLLKAQKISWPTGNADPAVRRDVSLAPGEAQSRAADVWRYWRAQQAKTSRDSLSPRRSASGLDKRLN